jgi:hypothetical protein
MRSNSKSVGQPHRAMLWLAAPCATLALYVLTWPGIEIKAATTIRVSGLNSYVGSTLYTHSGVLRSCPDWISRAYRPLHLLHGSNGGRNVLADHWAWWGKVLNHSAAPMSSNFSPAP